MEPFVRAAKSRMNILFYNWVDYDDLEDRGGGVSVYQKNLINEFLRSGEDRLCFLSSGIAYDFGARPYVRGLLGKQGVRRFEIVNSGVLSPAHHSFFSRAAISHPETEAVFSDFLEREGPFDLLHFNNLEGLPANVLALRKKFPATRFIFSLHNYYAFCPQVNLWYQEKEHCVDHANGERCTSCLLYEVSAASVVNANRLAFFLKKFGFMPGGFTFETAFKYGPTVKGVLSRLLRPMQALYRNRVLEGRGGGLASLKPDVRPFAGRRETFVDLINENVDWVLAVSRRVGEIAAEFGIAEGKIVVSYIGTRHAMFPSARRIVGGRSSTTAVNSSCATLDTCVATRGYIFFSMRLISCRVMWPQEFAWSSPPATPIRGRWRSSRGLPSGIATSCTRMATRMTSWARF